MGVNQIGKRLRPTGEAESEARCAQHRYEDLRLARSPRVTVNHDGNPISRVIHEQPLPRRVRLPHRRRQLRSKAAIEFAKARVAVTAGIGRDIFVPDDQQCDMLAFQLTMHSRPIWLGMEPMSSLASLVRV